MRRGIAGSLARETHNGDVFTGLVQAVVAVRAFDGRVLLLDDPRLSGPWEIGESVAVNGCCLTLVAAQDGLKFELSDETLSRTTLSSLAPGSRVNLERALRVGDRLGGHFVQGHVDGLGRWVCATQGEGSTTVRLQVPPAGAKFLIDKGSIAVDGVSLTVVNPQGGEFEVALVPHTLGATNLGERRAGDRVHIEYDVLAKHVSRLMQGEAER